MAKANEELKRRGSPRIDGPFRPVKDEERIDLTFGTRKPACRLSLESIDPLMGLSRMKVELFDERREIAGRMQYLLEGEAENVKAYKPLVEGFPDRGSSQSPEEIAQEIVPGIIRGRFV